MDNNQDSRLKKIVEQSVASDDGNGCAFFYGTLMVPAIFFTVCYGTQNPPMAIAKLHSFQPAILHGYCRRRVRFADYPGIVQDPKHEVVGIYATGLTKANMRRLDGFEGFQYKLKTVQVKLLDKVGNLKGEGNVEGEPRTAAVYVFEEKGDLEEREWDLEEFRRENLSRWVLDEMNEMDKADGADGEDD